MDLKTRTLAWVNSIRVEKLGRKPLKSLRRGVRRSARKCTLAVSLFQVRIAQFLRRRVRA